MRKLQFLAVLVLTFCTSSMAMAQQTANQIQTYFTENLTALGLKPQDVADWQISSQHTSKGIDVTHAYLQQQVYGIAIDGAVANFNLKHGEVLSMNEDFVREAASKTNTSSPVLTPSGAFLAGAAEADLILPQVLPELTTTAAFKYQADGSGISLMDLLVELVYVQQEDLLTLAWEVKLYPTDAKHLWTIYVDAQNGAILKKTDGVISCNFDHNHNSSCGEVRSFGQIKADKNTSGVPLRAMPAAPPVLDQYRVFALPIESPNHGERTLVVNPADENASPFGWHDTNGQGGAEYTITRGNNVYVYEDQDGNNAIGNSPSGTDANGFDFPLNLSSEPDAYVQVAATNLFYMNNMMHDIWYAYGFDEESGNFQDTNYGGAAGEDDYVFAEAQDGSGESNANFATPEDGFNPRMQMFLWPFQVTDAFNVNAPPSDPALDVEYVNTNADFSAPIPGVPIVADLALADDGFGDLQDACQPLVDPSVMEGKIALIRRGECFFVEKALAAQEAGALACIIVNNVAGNPVGMAGADGFGLADIPVIMISQEQGEALIDAILAGDTVNGTIGASSEGLFAKDGDFDNGVIAHEYGHGISTRLTGGALNSNCLGNDEQMGEGWSDWFGLMLTMRPEDVGETSRGMATYLLGQELDGQGLRPTTYSTDFAINGSTYATTNNEAEITAPHGVGYVWATMLWDLTWAFVDQYGFDPDFTNGTGGNNMVMQLVIDGLKIQPCSPGFVDGRDGILQADILRNNGANQCLIWQVFANRGLGASAQQGSRFSRTDQTESFDMPENISQNVTICSGETYTVGGNEYSEQGSYTDEITGTDGCTYNLTTNLSVAEVFGGFTVDGNDLFANNINFGVEFQWVDCDNDFAPVPGGTNSFYEVTENGNYSLITSENGCSSTAPCEFITAVGVAELAPLTATLSPNPTAGPVRISLSQASQNVQVQVLDYLGKIVFDANYNGNKTIDFELEGAAGIYTVRIIEPNGRRTAKKIIKR